MKVELENKQINSNVLRYYILQAIIFTPINLPILVLFWKANGLNMYDVFILQGIFAVAVVLLELPTGLIADKLGKGTSLKIATFVMTFGHITYASGSGFFTFLLAEIILSIGICLYSGADSSLLYDSLKKLNRQSEYKRIEGKSRAIQMIAFAVCNLIGGVVGSYSYRAAMWLSVIGPFIAFCVSLGFIEINKIEKSESIEKFLDSYKTLVIDSVKFIKKHKLVKWQIMFSAILTGSSSWLLWMYQPYMQYSGLPVWAFGIAFALFNLFAALMSNYAYKIEEKFGVFNLIILLITLQVLPLIFMSIIVIPVSFIFILGQQAVRGIGRPIINDWLLKYTFADKRSTVLSINSLIGRLFFAVTSPIIGFVSNNSNFETVLIFQAVILLLCFSLLLILYKGIPGKYFKVKDAVVLQQ